MADNCGVKEMAATGLNFCLSADDNYAQHLGVTAVSLIKAHQGQELNIYVLDSGISELNRQKIMSLADDKVRIKFNRVDDKEFRSIKFPSKSYFSLATFNRFKIPEMFADLDRVLYLDVDIIVLKDLSPFYNADLGDCALGMIKDWNGEGLKDITQTANYYNAGVMLFDIKKCLEQKLFDRLINGVKSYNKNFKLFDQDIINSTCQDIIKSVDFKYNAQAFPALSKNIEFIKSDMDEICVLHYTSAQKPWKPAWHPFEKYYLDCLAISPWRDRLAEITGAKRKNKLASYIFAINKQDNKKTMQIFKIPFLAKLKTDNWQQFYLFNIPLFKIKRTKK